MNGIQEVSGSIPLISTKSFEIFGFRSFFFTLRVFQTIKNSGSIPLISAKTNRKVGLLFYVNF